MSPYRYLRACCVAFIAILAGCASVAAERAALAGGDIASEAAHPAIPSDAGRSRDREAAPQEIVEACPDGGNAVPSEVVPERKITAEGAAGPPGLPGSQGDADAPTDGQAPPPELAPAYDPWEPFNRRVHRFNAVIDKTVARPVASVYVVVVPAPVRVGVSNFFDNLGQPATAVNALLQGRVRHSAEAVGRFLLNSTVGVAGLFDPAARLKMRERDEDFGQTLANWGWRRSRYLELPFFGPSTVRDAIGRVGDSPLQPLAHVESDKVRVGLQALGLMDRRTHLLNLDSLRAAAPDDYLLVRDSWTQRRDFQILKDARETALPDYLQE